MGLTNVQSTMFVILELPGNTVRIKIDIQNVLPNVDSGGDMSVGLVCLFLRSGHLEIPFHLFRSTNLV